MADLSQALRTFLLTKSEITDLVGERINPDVLLEGETLPAITYRRISTRHEQNLEGTKAGLAQTRIEFECISLTRSEANQIAEAIRRSGILDLQGDLEGINIRSVNVDAGQRHFAEPPEDGSHEFFYVTSQDYSVFYIEETDAS